MTLDLLPLTEFLPRSLGYLDLERMVRCPHKQVPLQILPVYGIVKERGRSDEQEKRDFTIKRFHEIDCLLREAFRFFGSARELEYFQEFLRSSIFYEILTLLQFGND